MSVKDEQVARQEYLQQKEAERQKTIDEAKQRAEETWEQYIVPIERPDIKEILWNGGMSNEKMQKRLYDLYNKMYDICKNRPKLLDNTAGLYRTIWYDTMSKQEKRIVDYFLWGKPTYNVPDDPMNL